MGFQLNKGTKAGDTGLTPFQAMLSCSYALNIKSSLPPAALNPEELPKAFAVYRGGMPELEKHLPKQSALSRIFAEDSMG